MARKHSRSRKGGLALKDSLPLAPRDLAFYNEEGQWTAQTDASKAGLDFASSASGAVSSELNSMSGGRRRRRHSHKKTKKNSKRGKSRRHKTAKKHHKRK
jgi:hypothetical protein